MTVSSRRAFKRTHERTCNGRQNRENKKKIDVRVAGTRHSSAVSSNSFALKSCGRYQRSRLRSLVHAKCAKIFGSIILFGLSTYMPCHDSFQIFRRCQMRPRSRRPPKVGATNSLTTSAKYRKKGVDGFAKPVQSRLVEKRTPARKSRAFAR